MMGRAMKAHHQPAGLANSIRFTLADASRGSHHPQNQLFERLIDRGPRVRKRIHAAVLIDLIEEGLK